jgi:hypothetical protein
MDSEESVSRGVRREVLDRIAISLSSIHITEIHQGLKTLCENGKCFNRIDAYVIHSLTESPHLTARQAALGHKLLTKYEENISQISQMEN